MIQLVLYSDRQNAVAGKLHTFAFTVKKLTFDIFGAFYFAFKIRHRQTAFAADNGTFPFGDNRIDKLDQAFANVDNYYSSGNTYLRRCQAYAGLPRTWFPPYRSANGLFFYLYVLLLLPLTAALGYRQQ